MEEEGEEERLGKDSAENTKIKFPKNKKIKSNNHVVKKRAGCKFPKTGKDVYVRRKSSIKAIITYCKKLLDTTDSKEIIIHGQGARSNKAINVGRHLVSKYSGTYDLDIQKEKIILTDDLKPINDDADYEVNIKSKIGVHVRVFPIANIGPLRFES
ncbi:ribonuclease P protein subunit p20 [Nasonia vitripennis]|uniref:Uncharacterized protein n=1 Tax=Nasonia vitripennis TaxID=7425 RepID=A0A7M7PUL2_NASVI|nr:ribonuclease P protein subunit p20 [Nasonia vitripennis]